MCLTWAMFYIEMPGIHLLGVPETGSCRDAVDWFEIDQGHDESQWPSWKLSLAVMSVSESSEYLSQYFWFYVFLSLLLVQHWDLLSCCVLALASWLSTPGIQPYPAVSCVALFVASSLLPCLSPRSLTLLHLWGMRNTSTTDQKTNNTEPRCFVKLEILMWKFWWNYRRHRDPHKNLQKRAGTHRLISALLQRENTHGASAACLKPTPPLIYQLRACEILELRQKSQKGLLRMG